jgi:hypothetical protein
VLAGCRSPESARGELAVYLDFATRDEPVGPDVERRNPAFFAWLRGR